MPDYSGTCRWIALPQTNRSCTHNGKGMIASKKLGARTVLALIPAGVCQWRRPSCNALIRQALCELFKREADFEVCGEAENGREAIEKAQQLHPDLIVMDLSMPVMNGIEAASILKSLMPTVPLIIFSEYSDVFSEKEARSAGVSALVSKSEHASVLVGKARALLYHIAA